MTKMERSHDTALRILEVLKILLQDDVSKQEIIKKIQSNNNVTDALTFEAYIKYFNTFNALGLNVIKKDSCYSIENALIKMDLSQLEENVFKKLLKSVKKLNNENKEEKLKNFIYRLDKYLNFDARNELNKIYNEPVDSSTIMNIVNSLKRIMLNQSEVSITYKKRNKTQETIKASINKIIEEKGHYFVLCSNSKMLRCKRINAATITALEESPKKSGMIQPKSTVIYEVYDRLAKSYKLKAWETLVDFGDGYMRISNKEEDLDTLLNRLLKYGENCKIIQPSNIVDDFLSLTNDVLANLEASLCLE